VKKEEKFTYAGDYPLIKNGTYEAQYFKPEDIFICKTRKRVLKFRVTMGEYQGVVLPMFFNMPYNKKIKQGSKYYKTWCMVNGWQKPTRNARLSPVIFKNKVYKIKTRTARPEYNGAPMLEKFWYSVVDSIELIT
jgi:hypothetical protein